MLATPGRIAKALDSAARGTVPLALPLIRQREVGQFYFGELSRKVGQYSTGVDTADNSEQALHVPCVARIVKGSFTTTPRNNRPGNERAPHCSGMTS